MRYFFTLPGSNKTEFSNTARQLDKCANLPALNPNDFLALVAKAIECHTSRTPCSSPSLRACQY